MAEVKNSYNTLSNYIDDIIRRSKEIKFRKNIYKKKCRTVYSSSDSDRYHSHRSRHKHNKYRKNHTHHKYSHSHKDSHSHTEYIESFTDSCIKPKTQHNGSNINIFTKSSDCSISNNILHSHSCTSSITEKDTSYFSWEDINNKIKSNSVLFDKRIDAIMKNIYNPVI